MFPSWWQNLVRHWSHAHGGPSRSAHRRPVRPSLESLEERNLLSTLPWPVPDPCLSTASPLDPAQPVSGTGDVGTAARSGGDLIPLPVRYGPDVTAEFNIQLGKIRRQ